MIGGKDGRRRFVGYRRGHEVIAVAAAASVPFSTTLMYAVVNGRRNPKVAATGHARKIGSARLKRQLHAHRGHRGPEIELRGHLEFGKLNFYLVGVFQLREPTLHIFRRE